MVTKVTVEAPLASFVQVDPAVRSVATGEPKSAALAIWDPSSSERRVRKVEYRATAMAGQVERRDGDERQQVVVDARGVKSFMQPMGEGQPWLVFERTYVAGELPKPVAADGPPVPVEIARR